MQEPKTARSYLTATLLGLGLIAGISGDTVLEIARPGGVDAEAAPAPSGAAPRPSTPSFEDRELRRLETQLSRLGATPLGVEPALALAALKARLPAGALGAVVRRALARRPHPLVRDALMWLGLQDARDRGDDREAARLREALGLLTETWWMLGPFDNEGGAGMSRLLPPELATAAPLPKEKTYTGKNAAVIWRRLPPLYPDGFLRPGEILEAAQSSILLLRTDVIARGPQVAALRLGTNGPYRLYCNGVLVAERDVRRPLRPDQDAIGLSLIKGRNSLLLVLGSEGQAPEAVARLTAATGGPLPGWTLADGGDASTLGPARAATLAQVWPSEPRRGASGDGVTVLGARPRPVAGPRVISARQALEEAVKKRPKDAAALAALSRYHLAVSPDDPREERALAAARAALALAPSAEAHLLVSRSHGQADAQRLALDEALKLEPKHAQALLELADHYYGAGQHHRAEALLAAALAADPGQVSAALRLAELAHVRRMPSLARTKLLDLEKRHPARPDVTEQLAGVEQDLGFHDQARRRLESLWLSGRTSTTLLHRLLGLAKQRLDAAGTERWLREMILARPDSMWAREALADVLAASGAPEAGLRLLREAIALAPRTHQLQVAQARVALRAGLVPLVLRALATALEIRPQDLASKRLLSYLERRGPDPLVARWAVDAATLARASSKRSPGTEDAEVLHHGIAFDVLPSGLSRRFQQQVILIHNRKGVEAWQTHHLDYLPDTQHLEVRVARVIRPDGSELDATRSDVSLGDPSVRMYYDRRLMVLRFRDLRPGDVLEIQTLLSDIPAGNLFKDYFGALLSLQARAPTLYLRLSVLLPPGRTLHANRPGLPGVVHRVNREANGTLHVWEAKGVRAAEPEPLGPGWAEEHQYLHLSTFGSWPEVARWYWGLVKEQFHADDAMRRAAIEATRTARTPRDKVLAIYHLVVTRTRYVALAFGMHTYKPYSAPQVFARKFGDCKDKAMLMAVLLRELGIESHPVLVRTRPGGQLADHPPSLAVFDHAILYVPGLDLWLDGTAERTGSGELPWADQGVAALIIDGGDGKRVRTPVLPATANLTRRSLDLTLSEDGTAEVTDRLVITGQEAPWWRRTFTDPQTRRHEFQRLVSAVFPRAEVSGVQFGDPDALEHPVTVEARYRVPGLARLTGRRVTLDLGLSESPLTVQLAPLSTRTQPVVYRFPFAQKVTVTVRWPRSWRLVKAPPTWAHRELGPSGAAALEGAQSVSTTSNRMVLSRHIDVRRHRFEAAEYHALRRFWIRADQLLGQPLELGRPGGSP